MLSDVSKQETLSTLKFMTSVKSVENKPQKNDNDSAGVLKTIREEISRLRDRVSAVSTKAGDATSGEDIARMEELTKDLQVMIIIIILSKYQTSYGH